MKYTTMFSSVAVVGLAAMLNAQTPQYPQNPPANPPATQPSAPSASAAQPKTVTFTGCVAPGTDAGSFVLSNVSAAGAAAAAASGAASSNPSGAAASAAQSAMTTDKSYKLVPQSSVNLAPHAGHKVEVTGVVREAAKTGTDAATQLKSVDVQSVKMIAATCS